MNVFKTFVLQWDTETCLQHKCLQDNFVLIQILRPDQFKMSPRHFMIFSDGSIKYWFIIILAGLVLSKKSLNVQGPLCVAIIVELGLVIYGSLFVAQEALQKFNQMLYNSRGCLSVDERVSQSFHPQKKTTKNSFSGLGYLESFMVRVVKNLKMSGILIPVKKFGYTNLTVFVNYGQN